MVFQIIQNCCSGVFMANNPDFERFSSREDLRRAIIDAMAAQGLAKDHIMGVFFVVNYWGDSYFKRRKLKKLGIEIMQRNYRPPGDGSPAHLCCLTLNPPIRKSWLAHYERKENEERLTRKIEAEVRSRLLAEQQATIDLKSATTGDNEPEAPGIPNDPMPFIVGTLSQEEVSDNIGDIESGDDEQMSVLTT